MKTLIINGSPRKNGDTAALIDELIRHLEGEVRVISCHDNISPCIDCRFCWKHEGCAIRDGMQEIYEYLTDCDNVVLASPVWFSSLSGPALNLTSRFQTYFSARRFRNAPVERKPKKGLILLAGGNAGTEVHPLEVARMILRTAGCVKEEITSVLSMNTDEVPAKDDSAALEQIRRQADRLNQPL
jgi:multimeric flavodoxin WrbA